MQCEQFEQRINELLDSRQPLEDEQLVSHAANCAECQASWVAYQQMMEVFAPAPVAARPRETAWMYRCAGLAAAAVLLWAFFNWPGSTSDTETLQVSAKPSPSNPQRANDVVYTRGAPPYLVHQPLVSIRLLSMGDWTQTMNQVEMPFGAQLPDVQTEWLSAVATSISPLQDSLTSTLNSIRRSVTPAGVKDTAS